MNSTVTVTVPATTANLGPGFDCLGAALTLYNQFTFSRLPTGGDRVVMKVSGAEADHVSTDSNNLVYQAFARLFQHLNQVPPPVQIEIQLGVPPGTGVGQLSHSHCRGPGWCERVGE
ncbi:hypothetical protein [Leptothermofonsia sp. ETS-13]|uniref:hypothetical protein n=1 Tax=Leptothermofonsia sp. ETS-13 TaxID=3035696 RepID=UPI003BA263F8